LITNHYTLVVTLRYIFYLIINFASAGASDITINSLEEKSKKTMTTTAECLITADYNPVCGSDGVTYANPSDAECRL